MIELTAEHLRERLSYDPITGVFTWLTTRCPKIRIGDRAGCGAHKDGYREIGLYGRIYLEHRLAWLHVFGEWPPGRVDHINGDRADNRLCNLRIATNGQNRANSKTGSNNILGIKGVTLTRSGSYAAQIRAGGRQMHIGTFATPEEARSAYMEAARKFHGEFARGE